MLYVVATPIGNLRDITVRAIDTLRECDSIVCEDTRVTMRLLNKYAIKKNLIPFCQGKESIKLKPVLERLERGENLCLVTDAGTPGISDVGFLLVNACHEIGIKTIPIPGVSSVSAAISVCPIPFQPFIFYGFLPKGKGERELLYDRWKKMGEAVIFYESPHRIRKTLSELAGNFPERRIAIMREMTKIYEEIIVGLPSEILKNNLKEKGEFIVILEKWNISPERIADDEALNEINWLIKEGVTAKSAISIISKRHGINGKKLYYMTMKARRNG